MGRKTKGMFKVRPIKYQFYAFHLLKEEISWPSLFVCLFLLFFACLLVCFEIRSPVVQAGLEATSLWPPKCQDCENKRGFLNPIFIDIWSQILADGLFHSISDVPLPREMPVEHLPTIVTIRNCHKPVFCWKPLWRAHYPEVLRSCRV